MNVFSLCPIQQQNHESTNDTTGVSECWENCSNQDVHVKFHLSYFLTVFPDPSHESVVFSLLYKDDF